MHGRAAGQNHSGRMAGHIVGHRQSGAALWVPLALRERAVLDRHAGHAERLVSSAKTALQKTAH